jgi:hypothetical protein
MADGPGKEVWYGAPTYRAAKLIFWRPLKRMLRPYIVGKPNESELHVDLTSGGRIRLVGLDNYDSLRGSGLDGFIGDEFADAQWEAWVEVIRPALADRRGKALFIGTPKGFNHFYELWDRGRSGQDPDWSAHQFTTAAGGNVTQDELEAARRDMDVKTYRQEFEASFENIGSGRAYYAFDRQGNVTAVEFNPRKPLCWALDFNIDPMCSVLAQIDGEKVRVLEEMCLPDTSTFEACDEFIRRTEKYLVQQRPLEVQVYGDATGQNRQHAGTSDHRILKEFFARHSDKFRMGWNFRSNNPAVKDRIAATNGRAHNHAGERNLLVHPSCKELIADLEQVMWAEDASGNRTGKLDASNAKRTHVSDALGYLIEKEFGLRIQGGMRSVNLGII